ncbi:50S ribosomal protein L13 [Candidatus Pacearchaeota archaeon]|nr:50S ribosomal protein L13 [Candidatus Pacearchaeota archaeon]
MEKDREKAEVKEIVIDATNATLGRLASFAAKQALLGHKIVIVNSERAIISGSKKDILEKYKRKIKRGIGSLKGPYFPKQPEDILKRTIRGMLKYKRALGNEAFNRVICYKHIPHQYANIKKITTKAKEGKFMTLGELSRLA